MFEVIWNVGYCKTEFCQSLLLGGLSEGGRADMVVQPFGNKALGKPRSRGEDI
jgi:hypothetical protein